MNAYLFDVDGVITDPATRSISKPQLVTHLITLLQKGNPIGIISGRGLIWLRSRVVKVLENYLDDHPMLDRTILNNVFISGEFGGVTAHYENGERKESINKALILSQEIRNALEEKAKDFKEYVFVDIEKQTQFTLEANFEKNTNLMDDHGDTIAAGLQQIIHDQPVLEVQVDRIAVNVKNKNANKRYATNQFLTWLSEKGLKLEKFYVFGDSPSDLEMGNALHEQGLVFDFIFVGETNELPKETLPFHVIITKGHCDAGTLEYLETHELLSDLH